MIRTVKRWPYVVFGLIIDAFFLTLLLMANLAPDKPWISGGYVFLWWVVISIIIFVSAYLLYSARLTRYPYQADYKGISVLTDDQARDELIRRANKQFSLRFIMDPSFSIGKSVRVGTENTDVYVMMAKEDIFPSDTYIIMAVSKEDPSRWNFETFSGNYDEEITRARMIEIAEALASKPERRTTQTIERRHPVTGEVMAIETITRPENIRRFAQEQLEPREELV